MAKKIVVVGGGISGLTAGVYARKAGFAVEVYEKHAIVGGECTGWDRQGYHIDNCIHWLMGTTPGTALNDIWRETGALGPGVEVLQSEHMYASELGGERLTLWKDLARTEREMIALSPADEAATRALMRTAHLAEKVQIPASVPPELMGPLELTRMALTMRDALKLFKEYKDMDTQDLMNRFQHPLIRAMISDFCTKESLAQSFPMAYGNYTGGDGGLPKGGSRALAQRMRARLEGLGGKVFTGAPAAKIVLEGGRATGIALEGGAFVPADYVVCSCDPDFTFHHLLDESFLDPVLREAYDNPRDYPIYGMFQAAFAVDCATDALQGDVMLDARDLIGGEPLGERLTVKTYAYEPEFAPPGKQILQILWGTSGEYYEYWRSLYDDKAAYAAKKAELAGRAQRRVEERFPLYKGKLRLLDVWTPVTYNRYCNAYRGYNQAFTITKRSRKNPYPAAWVKGLENVVLAGQWLSPPGGLPGAAIQGKYAIQRILRKEKRPIKL